MDASRSRSVFQIKHLTRDLTPHLLAIGKEISEGFTFNSQTCITKRARSATERSLHRLQKVEVKAPPKGRPPEARLKMVKIASMQKSHSQNDLDFCPSF